MILTVQADGFSPWPCTVEMTPIEILPMGNSGYSWQLSILNLQAMPREIEQILNQTHCTVGTHNFICMYDAYSYL